jgi:hypothetical protein
MKYVYEFNGVFLNMNEFAALIWMCHWNDQPWNGYYDRWNKKKGEGKRE